MCQTFCTISTLWDCHTPSFHFFLTLSTNTMASVSSERSSTPIVEITFPGVSLPLCIPSGPQGVARITSQLLSIRFGFDVSSLWIERDVVDPDSSNVLYSVVVEPSPVLVNGNHV